MRDPDLMEKYGIEMAEKEDAETISAMTKTAMPKCPHPATMIKVDGDMRFCTKCEKYLSN